MLYQLGTGMRAFRALVSAPEVAFTPSSIANLGAWFDSADLATIIQSGGAVSQWNDKSGNNYHATQATGANQPVTGARTLNGLNVLDFDGSNDRLELFSHSALAAVPSGANTLFVVYQSDIINSNIQTIFAGATQSNSIRWGVRIDGGSANLSVLNNTGFTPANHGITLDTNPHIAGLRRVGTALEPICDTVHAAQSLATDVTLSSYLNIGAQGDGQRRFDGIIAEILLYTRGLGDSEMNQIGNYLAAKWGMTWTNI